MSGWMRRLRRRDERGAGTLEYVGVTILGAVLVLGLLYSPASGDIGNGFRGAVCSVIQRTDCEEPNPHGEPGDPGDPPSGQTPLEDATDGEYVAIGDSFASGEGAWDYEDGTDFDDRDDLWPFNNDEEAHNRCHRSGNAYSQILSENNDFAGGTNFRACSGATIEDLNNPNDGNTDEPTQYDALNEDTSLVTVSIGGNDLGFADVLKDCIINGARGVGFIEKCQDKHGQRIEDRLVTLYDDLMAEYAEIRRRAPNARIIVVGYPPLFVDNPSDSYGNLLFAEDQVWMNEQAAALNAVIRQAAADSGVEFVDPTSAFQGHGIGSDDPWFNDLDWGGPGFSLVDPSSFHPNAQGHQAFADLIQQQLENPQYP